MSVIVCLLLLTGISHRLEDSDSDPLLDELEARRESAQIVAITIPKLFMARELRKSLAIICLAMASQQLSGEFVRRGFHR